MPRSANDAAASQPMKPDPITTADDAVGTVTLVSVGDLGGFVG